MHFTFKYYFLPFSVRIIFFIKIRENGEMIKVPDETYAHKIVFNLFFDL